MSAGSPLPPISTRCNLPWAWRGSQFCLRRIITDYGNMWQIHVNSGYNWSTLIHPPSSQPRAWRSISGRYLACDSRFVSLVPLFLSRLCLQFWWSVTCLMIIVTRLLLPSMYWSSPVRSTLNTGYITGVDMCKVCTEAVQSVALWTRVTLQVWTCVKYVLKQSSP